MRTILALLFTLCASLFAVGSASAGGIFAPGSSLVGATEDAGYTLVKSKSITVTICGPWNNWCAPKGGKPKCGKWNNWCGQANKGSQKCGKWNDWCGQANNGGQKCGKGNNWCKDSDNKGGKKKKEEEKQKQANEKAAAAVVAGTQKCLGMGLVPAGALSGQGFCNCPAFKRPANPNGLVKSPAECF
jgi:hypothetical protein